MKLYKIPIAMINQKSFSDPYPNASKNSTRNNK